MDQMDSKSGRFLSAIFGDHPANQARRDLYAQDLSEYSGGRVSADPATGGIYINGIYVFTPREHSGRSGLERAYLSAGAIAESFHNSGGNIPAAEFNKGIVHIGKIPIYKTSGKEEGYKIAAAINAAANAEK